jgi:hypothetical protein
VIVLFWIGTTGWFVHRELWPALFPSDAPPFVIDLGDEITSHFAGHRSRSDALWTLYRNDELIGMAETRLRYIKEDNTFEMETRVRDLKMKGLVSVEIPELINAYRINRQGELRGLRLTGSMTIKVLGFSYSGSMEFTGEVKENQLFRSGFVDLPGLGKVHPKLDPIEAPKGSILNPMHPVPKVRVRPGHRWRMPVMDPLADALEPVLQAVVEELRPGQPIDWKKLLPTRSNYMDATVLDERVEIEYNQVKTTCFVIEFRGDGRTARTYVRESDGAVMRQEAFAQGERITLIRL